MTDTTANRTLPAFVVPHHPVREALTGCNPLAGLRDRAHPVRPLAAASCQIDPASLSRAPSTFG